MDNKMNSNDVTRDLDDKKSDVDSSSHYSEESFSKEHHHRVHHHHSGHHHSGGRHHHSSHSHRSSSRNKRKKINPKLVKILAISLFVLLTISVIIFEMTNHYKTSDGSPSSGDNSLEILSVEVVNKEGVIIKDAVSKYLLTDLLNSYNADVVPSVFSNGEGRLDEQVPVALKLSTKTDIALSYKIELADNEEFNNAEISYVESSAGTYEFEHLYANAKYFYRVTVYTSKGTDSVVGHFKTSDTPRILSIEGLSNVRDIGNWRTDSGKRIKQGLLIRGTEMDGAVERGYHLTNEGLMDMLYVFGIKTDLDLRTQTPISKDALGSRVEHRYYNMVVYSDIFTDEGKDKIRMVFSDLANPDNYPIYLHCTYGCDRTGTVCYLLEALLGVSRGDCLKDYGLSNLNISNIIAVENGLKAYKGNTLKEQVESYLLSCGVSEYQIDSIVNIFLGD